ncbi:MAG TPA: DUF5362 family protein [Acidobacteriaceae bacterium]
MSETKRFKLLGIVPIALGAILTVTIVGAIVGVPMIIFGILVRRSYASNLKVAEEALAEHFQSLKIVPAV